MCNVEAIIQSDLSPILILIFSSCFFFFFFHTFNSFNANSPHAYIQGKL